MYFALVAQLRIFTTCMERRSCVPVSVPGPPWLATVAHLHDIDFIIRFYPLILLLGI